jgi:hypothetical protein
MKALITLSLTINLCSGTPYLLDSSNLVAKPILPDESSGAVDNDHLQGT